MNKELTAIGELIKCVDNELLSSTISDIQAYHLHRTKIKAIELLIKERKDIETAFNDGYYCASNGTQTDLEKTSEKYYTQTFTTDNK